MGIFLVIQETFLLEKPFLRENIATTLLKPFLVISMLFAPNG